MISREKLQDLLKYNSAIEIIQELSKQMKLSEEETYLWMKKQQNRGKTAK